MTPLEQKQRESFIIALEAARRFIVADRNLVASFSEIRIAGACGFHKGAESITPCDCMVVTAIAICQTRNGIVKDDSLIPGAVEFRSRNGNMICGITRQKNGFWEYRNYAQNAALAIVEQCKENARAAEIATDLIMKKASEESWP